MVYMSRMPVGGREGQSRLSKRSGDEPKRSAGNDGISEVAPGLETERESLFGGDSCKMFAQLPMLIKNTWNLGSMRTAPLATERYSRGK